MLLQKWRDQKCYATCLERHANEVWVVVYKAESIAELGQATNAVERREPSLAELQMATARVLGLSQKKKFAYRESITGVATYSRNANEDLVEHLDLSNEQFNDATATDLRRFLAKYLE